MLCLDHYLKCCRILKNRVIKTLTQQSLTKALNISDGITLNVKLSIYMTCMFKCRSSAWLQEPYCTQKQSKSKSLFSCADVGDKYPAP